MASQIRPSLDYTNRDFDALRARLFNLISSAFPEWTDQQVANFGNILVELYAFVGDVFGFYQDSQAKESRWSSAQLRRSMLSLVKLIEYVPTGASAATANITLELAASPIGSVTFQVGDTFRTLDLVDPVVFQAVTTATISPGADPATAVISVENSAAAEDLVQSTDLPDQVYVLGEAPFLDGSLVITAGDGAYTVQQDFLRSGATDKHAVVAVDENDKAHVTFGNGVAGSIPTGSITFTYKTGGGPAGNVDVGAIAKAVKSYTDNLGNPVIVSVTNLLKAGGGLDRQTVEGIRQFAPKSLRTLTRTVSREDYETNALRVPGVVRALMMSKDEKPSVLENNGELYIVPAGGGAAADVLLTAVATMIDVTYPKTITFRLRVFSATYLLVNIAARVHLAKGSVPGTVGPAIRASIASFFAIVAVDGSTNQAIDFGYYMDGALAWSDVFNVVRDTVGVRKIDDGLGALTLNGAAADLSVPVQQFPILGTVTLVDAVTGIPLP